MYISSGDKFSILFRCAKLMVNTDVTGSCPVWQYLVWIMVLCAQTETESTGDEFSTHALSVDVPSA